MRNVVLTRIDDRLMHGQVIVSWIPYLNVKEVVIIDDEYAKDDFMSLLFKNAAPENVEVHIFALNDAINYLNKSNDDTRILILLRGIDYINALLKEDVKLNKLNVGNLGSNSTRTKYHNSVYLSKEELELLKEASQQIEVEIKMLPNDKALVLE